MGSRKQRAEALEKIETGIKVAASGTELLALTPNQRPTTSRANWRNNRLPGPTFVRAGADGRSFTLERLAGWMKALGRSLE